MSGDDTPTRSSDPGEARAPARAGVSERPRGLRAGLRRLGLVRRPTAVAALTRAHDLRFTDGNRIALYETGRPGLDAMLDAIEAARERIHLETYILRSDATGERFLAALAARARNGVAVRVLYDAVGSRSLHGSALDGLRAAGGDVIAFNPLGRIYPHFAPRRRDHRKILVVDGRVAFTGGLNIGDEYYGGLEGPSASWRDAHVRVEGPAVRDLEAVFLESWFRADGPGLVWSSFLDSAPAPCGDSRCAVLADGPVYRRRRTRALLIGSLGNADQTAGLTSPYFAPGRRILEALSAAGERGVRVDLLLAGQSDHPLLRRAARARFPRLLRAGVHVFEYERAMMHAKTAVFDESLAVIGTSNLDRQSFERSYEVNLVIAGGEVPRQLRANFERDCRDANIIDAKTLDARGAVERGIDALAALLLRLV